MKKYIGIALSIMLAIMLPISALASVPQSEVVGIESADTTPIITPRVLVGTSLFELTYTNLYGGELVVTSRTNKFIPQGTTNFGLYVVSNGSARIGVCYIDGLSGNYVHTGRVTVSNTNGQTHVYSFTTSPDHVNSTRYGYAEGTNATPVSGTAKFIGM